MVLSVNTDRKVSGGQYGPLPTAASANPYQGSLLSWNSSGYVNELVAGEKFAGVCIGQIPTAAVGASNGVMLVEAIRGDFYMEMYLSGVAVTDIGKPVYATADDAITLVPQTGSTAYTFIGYVDGVASSNYAVIRAITHESQQKATVHLANVAASANVSNTTDETAFDKTYTIPGGSLKIGDRISILAQGIAPSTNGGDTLNIKLYTNTTELCATGAVDAVNDDQWHVRFDMVIRTIGGTGTFVGAGLNAIGAAQTTAKVCLKASTTIDTTADQVISVKATWNAASANDQVRLDILDVTVTK